MTQASFAQALQHLFDILVDQSIDSHVHYIIKPYLCQEKNVFFIHQNPDHVLRTRVYSIIPSLDPKAIGEQMLPYGFLYVANQGFFTVKFNTNATDAMAKRTAKGIA